MKIWFDTEFIEDGHTIDLISIGIVREDNKTLYMENKECDLSRASVWVKENVLPNLTGEIYTRNEIANSIVDFVGEYPEFWAYYADYDWVVLCQLYGTMMNLPKSWPMYCKDFKQYLDNIGNPTVKKQSEGLHNSLSDAIWLKQSHTNLIINS
jgi:hypothetical protein